MLTTLYCDASFCPQTHAGGWGVWLRSNRGRVVRSGITPHYVIDANEAELAAIYAGVFLAVRHWPETEAILVRSDSRTALSRMDDYRKARREGAKKLAEKIRELQKKHDVRLISRWVKGHRSGSAVDVYLNNRVDEMAREAMQGRRGDLWNEKEHGMVPMRKGEKP